MKNIPRVTLTFSPDEAAILAELRARLGLKSDADLLRVALWMYANGQGLHPSPLMFAVEGKPARRRST